MFIKIWSTLTAIDKNIGLESRVCRKIFYDCNYLTFNLFLPVIDGIFDRYCFPDRVFLIKIVWHLSL